MLHNVYFSGSNLILKGALDDYGSGNPINFASWMQYATIPMIINFFLCWLWLQMFYLGLPKRCNAEDENDCGDGDGPGDGGRTNVRNVIRQQYKELGPMNFHEAGVLACFLVLILLWIFREPQFMTGWGDFFHTR